MCRCRLETPLPPRAPSFWRGSQAFLLIHLLLSGSHRVKGRPHYYSTKKEEYAIIKFSLDADLSSLFTWNTKQVFVYVTAEWGGMARDNVTAVNQAVVWDQIVTAPSADHLANIGPAALKKLRKSAKGKSIDPSRYLFLLPVHPTIKHTHTRT